MGQTASLIQHALMRGEVDVLRDAVPWDATGVERAIIAALVSDNPTIGKTVAVPDIVTRLVSRLADDPGAIAYVVELAEDDGKGRE